MSAVSGTVGPLLAPLGVVGGSASVLVSLGLGMLAWRRGRYGPPLALPRGVRVGSALGTALSGHDRPAATVPRGYQRANLDAADSLMLARFESGGTVGEGREDAASDETDI